VAYRIRRYPVIIEWIQWF